MPFSHHSHSGQFCKHAKGTLEEVVQEAIRKGFKIYALTEHVPRYRVKDFYPEEDGLTLEQLQNQFVEFLAEAHRLKSLYSSQITLLVGAETELISPLDLQNLTRLMQERPGKIEFLVGSVHHVNEIPIDFDKETYLKALDSFNSQDEVTQRHIDFLCEYFDKQYDIMTSLNPEVIGHMDLCRLYDPTIRFPDYPAVWMKIQRNVDYAIAYGALFEINSAALRKGWETPYPGKDIVELIRDRGGRFALSDDSHGPQGVGLNYDKMYDYFKDAEMKDIWYLEHSGSIKNAAGRSLIPRKAETSWLDDSFWKHLKCTRTF